MSVHNLMKILAVRIPLPIARKSSAELWPKSWHRIPVTEKRRPTRGCAFSRSVPKSYRQSVLCPLLWNQIKGILKLIYDFFLDLFLKHLLYLIPGLRQITPSPVWQVWHHWPVLHRVKTWPTVTVTRGVASRKRTRLPLTIRCRPYKSGKQLKPNQKCVPFNTYWERRPLPASNWVLWLWHIWIRANPMRYGSRRRETFPITTEKTWDLPYD